MDLSVLQLFNAKLKARRLLSEILKFEMFENCLNSLYKERNFQVLSQLICAADELSGCLTRVNFVIDKVLMLNSIKLEISQRAKREVQGGFNSLGRLVENDSRLRDACKALEICGFSHKFEVIEFYCELLLRDYLSIFRLNVDFSGLDSVPRRFTWLNKLLTTISPEIKRIFPANWHVDTVLIEKFCAETKRDLIEIMQRGDFSVEHLISAMRETAEFEDILVEKYQELKFKKSISQCFEPFLNLFINEKNLEILQFVNSKKNSFDSNSSVLDSSAELFLLYRKILQQSIVFDSRRTFYELSGIFFKNVGVYCENCAKVPKPDEKKIFVLLNTADYLNSTCTQLSDKLSTLCGAEYASRMDEIEFKEPIGKLINQSISSLVNRIVVKISGQFDLMLKRNWGSVDLVGDESDYVKKIYSIIESSKRDVDKNVRNAKYSNLIIDRLSDKLSKEMKLKTSLIKFCSIQGAGQLLLDTQCLKGFLLKLGANSLMLSSLFEDLIVFLKLLGSSLDPAEIFIDNFLIMNDKVDFCLFRKILEMRRMKKERIALYESQLDGKLRGRERIKDEQN